MRSIFLSLAICALLAAPLSAEGEGAPDARDHTTTPLFDRFERLLRDFATELEPQMREFERGFEALEPDLQGFLERLRGMTQYHPPEILPNGDILIRRRQSDEDAPGDAPPMAPSDPSETPSEAPSEFPFEL